jgi:hypothetical protein
MAVGGVRPSGGFGNAGLLADTWEFQLPASLQPTWGKDDPTSQPTARQGATMVFDPATGNLVLFGGSTSSSGTSGLLADTWIWNGTAWTMLDPPTSPPARADASMAFDPATGSIVLFGGTGADGPLSDTWTWNGVTWAPAGVPGPSARSGASMAFDSVSGAVLLFGGLQAPDAPLSDTWSWNGSSWTEVSPATSPPARSEASLMPDPATGSLVLFGGLGQSAPLDDTWTWNGTTWSQAEPATSPPSRWQAAQAFDPAIGDDVVFGGAGTTGATLADTWAWTGMTWQQLQTTKAPTGPSNSEMAFDPQSGDIVLFGGATGIGGTVEQGTWSLAEANPPPATITGVTLSGLATDPTVTVTGSGFGVPLVGGPASCFLGTGSGSDYQPNQLYLTDVTGSWYAGQPTDCVGIDLISYSSKQVVFQFGNYYNSPGYDWELQPGDVYTIGVNGAMTFGQVSFQTPSIASVVFTGTSKDPTVTVTGTNLGGAPSGSANLATCYLGTGTGADYPLADVLSLTDSTTAWYAGQPTDCVGIDLISYSQVKVVFQFGSYYETNGWVLKRNDGYQVDIAGTIASGTVRYH